MTAPVTIAVPTLNEEGAIRECLCKVLAQTHSDLQVIVADGGSTDRTRAIVAEVAAGDGRITLVDNPGRRQSAGLNRALALAEGEVLIRLDARSFVAADYVERCVQLLAQTGAAVVGGRMVARSGTSFAERGIALANGAWWGAGPARFHKGGPAGPVDTVYLGAFRVEWLTRVGGWAEDVGVNEDFELNHRIRDGGGTVWFDPELIVEYEPRRTYRALAKQYYRYGMSKAVVVRRHPRSTRVRQLLPALLVPTAVVAMAPGRCRQAARAALAAYSATMVVAASRSADGLTRRVAGLTAGATMHWTWSAGFVRGSVGRCGI